MGINLGEKVGPLPLGAWIVVVGGGLGIGFYARSKSATTAAATPLATGTVPDANSANGLTDGALSGGSATSAPGTFSALGSFLPAAITNDGWRTNAITALLAKGFSATAVDSAISNYFTGGYMSAQDQAIIDEATGFVGPTPFGVPPLNTTQPVSTITPAPVQATPVASTTPASVVQPAPTPAPYVAPTPPSTAPLVPVVIPVATQQANPVPADTSAYAAGTSDNGSAFSYGGSQQQVDFITHSGIYGHDSNGNPVTMLGAISAAGGEYTGRNVGGGAPVYALINDVWQQNYSVASLAPGTILGTTNPGAISSGTVTERL